MRANSLALRLFLSATAWTVVILLITGIVLSSLYRQAVERAFDRRLGVYLRTLVADVAAPEEASDKFPQSLGEPLFELPLSGWYWQVTRLDPAKPEVRSSRSLWDGGLPHLRRPRRRRRRRTARARAMSTGRRTSGCALVERTIDLGDDGRYLVAVAGDAAEIDDETRAFDQRADRSPSACWRSCCCSPPCSRCASAWRRSSAFPTASPRSAPARAERLEGEFPDEIAPLARETNALIDANREIVERARTHVGNLAHALKTPLSVMVNEAAARGDDPLAAKVREQADIMRDQVARHLERARLAARSTVVGTVTEVAPVVTALARTMEKIHRDRGIAIDVDARRRGALPRRAAGPRGDGRQSGRQCLQVGAVAGRDRGAARAARRGERGRSCASWSTTTARACRRREREQVGAPRPPARRDQAGLGPRPFDRDRTRGALWRRA